MNIMKEILMRNYFLLLFVLFLFIGCSSTKLTTFIDPDFKNLFYEKILVYSISTDLAEKKQIEDAFKFYFLTTM